MKVRHAYPSAIDLLSRDQFASALTLVERAVDGVAEYADWTWLAEVFKLVPKEMLNQPRWAWAYTATLVGLRNEALLLEFSEHFLVTQSLPDTAPVLSDRAWGLINQERYAEAREILEVALPHLSNWRLGVAWRRLGRCYFELEEDWQGAFTRAYQHLSGRLKGLALMEEAACWQRINQTEHHRSKLLEALTLLDSDPYHLAWVRHSLGLSYLRELHPDAERHFQASLELTRHKSAALLRSQAWQGLGNLYRSRGEWPRAEAAYQEAIATAADQYDQRVALWSLGRCYRLQGQLGKSIEILQKSLSLYPSPQAPVQVDRAATLLAMGKSAEAKSTLDAVENLIGSSLWLATILYAEIARLEGDGIQALQLLKGLPCHLMVVREEAACWPELFTVARLVGQPVPVPLEYSTQMRVRVQSLGTLEVWVNERKVNLAPTSKTGELLVLLLEQGGQAASETLIECLWPDTNPISNKRQNLWQLVRELRHHLGWPGSIQGLGKAFGLDPDTQWEFDLAEARKTGRADAPFLQGVYSPWAQEIGEEVEHLRGWGEHRSDLN